MRNEIWTVMYWTDATLEREPTKQTFSGDESRKRALNFVMALPARARVAVEMTGDALGG